jgi:hypothetical protein
MNSQLQGSIGIREGATAHRTFHTIPYHSIAVEPPIGIQDTRHMSEDWRFGCQASDNEHTLYIELFPGFQIGVREGARCL